MKKYTFLTIVLVMAVVIAGMVFAQDDITYTNKTFSKKGVGYKIDIKYPLFFENDPLAEAINQDIKETMDSTVMEFQKKRTGANKEPYTLSTEYKIFSDDKIKSVIMYFNEYKGNAPESSSYHTYSYVMDNGKAKKSKLFFGDGCNGCDSVISSVMPDGTLSVCGVLYLEKNPKIPAGSTLKISLHLEGKKVPEIFIMPFTKNDMAFNVKSKGKVDNKDKYSYEMFAEIIDKDGKKIFSEEPRTYNVP